MSIWLDGKIVLVTGGARGIGADIARAFATAGASVMITDILTAEGEATAGQIRKAGGRARFLEHDVRDEQAWQSVIEATVQELGGLTTLVNNAGIEETGPLAEFDVDAFRRLFDVNVTGLFLGMKHAMRAMRPGGSAGKGGSILNLSSLSALRAEPCFGAYGATKSAVERLTKVGAVEGGKLGWNIRVNCLYPGIIDTAMQDKLQNDLVRLGFFPSIEAVQETVLTRTPLGRVGTVADVTQAALYLSSDAASFITGVGLSVDGGMALG
jgi:NAD(P)-dependent dehydrogenase (short-subunit alcohol dehydrogenase family)